MARDSSGTYTLPAGNPVASGSTISSTTHNNTNDDIGDEITDSLSRSGKGGMQAPLLGDDGTVLLPGYSFVSDPNTGIYRPTDDELNIAVGGVIAANFDDSDINLYISGALAFTLLSTGLTLNANDTPDLTDNTNALNIGVGTGQHLAMGGNDVQSKSDATTAAALDLNPLGGAVNVGPQSGSGAASLWNGGTKRIEAASDGMDVTGTAVDLNDASNGSARFRVWTDGGGVSLNAVTSTGQGRIEQLNNSGGVTAVFATFDQSGGVNLNHGGATKLATTSSGADVTSSAGALLDVVTSGTNTDSVLGLRGNANGGLRLYWDESASIAYLAQTTSAGSLEDTWASFTKNGRVSLYEDGTERFRTADEADTSQGTGASVKDGGGTFRPVGLHVTPPTTVSANTDLRLANSGFLLRCTSAVTVDIDTTTDSAANGSKWELSNVSGGNVTISATGVTLTWLDGAGGQTGNRTVADGSKVVVTKISNGQYEIAGNGIT